MSANKNISSSLSYYINEMVETYFSHVDDCKSSNLYQMILTEVEGPLFKAVIKHTEGNLSKAAEVLGINRGTLRKKLKGVTHEL